MVFMCTEYIITNTLTPTFPIDLTWENLKPAAISEPATFVKNHFTLHPFGLPSISVQC